MYVNVEDRGIKGDIIFLMVVVNGGYVKIVKLLLVYKVDVNVQFLIGNIVFIYVCVGGYVDVVKVFLEFGVSIEDYNENGYIFFMEVGSVGYVEVVRLLLENGVGINMYFNEFKESVFILVCYKGYLEMV